MTDKRGQRLPYFDEVKITVARGPREDARLFLEGKCDACETLRPEQYGEFRQAAAKGR